jgi:hypothetical protein
MLRVFRQVLALLAVVVVGSRTAGAQVFNGGIPGGFTCVGSCGVSGADGVVPLAPGGGTQFGWISTFGGVTMDPLVIDGTTNGSVLTSSTFAATAGQLLSFRFNYVTSDGGPYDDYGFVRLLGAGAPLVLFSAQTIPDGNTVPGLGLPGLASGVTLSPSSTVVIPGAPAFSPLGLGSTETCYDLGCGYTGWIRAAYTIQTAGNYQLEFGVFNLLDDQYDTALAIDYAVGSGEVPETPEDNPGSVVPEPSTWLLLGSGLLLMAVWSRRRIV